MTDQYTVTANELRAFVDRAEAQITSNQYGAEVLKEIFTEAKDRGYDTAVMKKVIALRKRKPDDVAEEEAVMELYKSALGMM